MMPPNVTGNLHMGHALTFTLQDLLIRYHRMAGRDTLWQPVPTAGIATQMVVERQLAAQNISRVTLGVMPLLIKSGNGKPIWWHDPKAITTPWRFTRLGSGTLYYGPGSIRAVIKVFVALHRDGLIYRDKRLVNWDPKLMTAISDLEVEQRDKQVYVALKYRLVGVDNEFISIATTRPEAMLGDGAVASIPKMSGISI